MAAAWVAVVVTYYRFVAVSRPLHARQSITMSRVQFVVASVWMGTAIIYVPNIVHWLLRLYVINRKVNTAKIVVSVLQLLFINWLPISLTMFFNIRLILEVNNSRTIREQLLPSRDNSDNRAANNSRRVTVTMTVIIIVYLVCQLPSAIIETLRFIDSYIIMLFHVRQAVVFYSVSMETGICLIVINSLSDCVTYFLMGKRSREILISVLSCRRDLGK
jgi:hypothetical protein